MRQDAALSRKASNSSLMNRGNSAPVQASVCVMKLAACCCTRRYSVVSSGRWRSEHRACDFQSFAKQTGNEIVEQQTLDEAFIYILRRR